MLVLTKVKVRWEVVVVVVVVLVAGLIVVVPLTAPVLMGSPPLVVGVPGSVSESVLGLADEEGAGVGETEAEGEAEGVGLFPPFINLVVALKV